MRRYVGTLDEKKERLTTPHQWFAWYPIWTVDGYFVWLEYVWRAAEPWSVTWDGEGGEPFFVYRVEPEIRQLANEHEDDDGGGSAPYPGHCGRSTTFLTGD